MASVLSCRQDVGEVVPSVKIISDGVSLRNGRIAFETLNNFKKAIGEDKNTKIRYHEDLDETTAY